MSRKTRSSCVDKPVEECYLAKECSWAKASDRSQAHCRKTPTAGGNVAALGEWNNFFSQFRAQNPHMSFIDARRAASTAWHSGRGTQPKARKNHQWRENPLFGQQMGGNWDYDQYGGVGEDDSDRYAMKDLYWDLISRLPEDDQELWAESKEEVAPDEATWNETVEGFVSDILMDWDHSDPNYPGYVRRFDEARSGDYWWLQSTPEAQQQMLEERHWNLVHQ